MPRFLQFLGFTIDLGAAGQIPVNISAVPEPTQLPQNCIVREWHVAISNGIITADHVWLDFGSHTSVVLGLSFPVDDDGTTISLKAGAWPNDIAHKICMITGHLADMPADSSISLNIGAFTARGEFGDGSVVVEPSGRVAMRMDTISAPTFGWVAPIALEAPKDAKRGLIYLDLASGQLGIGEGAYQLRTSTVMQSGDATYVAATQVHHLRAQALDLSNNPSSIDLRFQGDSDPIHLHVERLNRSQAATAADPLQVAIQARQFDLVLTLTHIDDGSRRATALKLISTGGPSASVSDTLRLITHGLGDVLNASVTWRFVKPEVSVPLLMRWGNGDRPSALLLAPTLASAGGEQSLDVTPEGLADSRLHGDIMNSVANLSSIVKLSAALTPKQQVPFPDGSVPGNLTNEFDELTLAEATTPYLAWTPAGTAFERARPGNTYRQNTRGEPATRVETYRFSGAPLALPALPLPHIDVVDTAYSQSFRQYLDNLMTGMAAPIGGVVHETLRQEGPVQSSPTVGLSSIFTGAAINAPNDTLRLAEFSINQIFNIANKSPATAALTPLTFLVQRPPNSIPDYIIAEIAGGLDQVTIPPLDFEIATNSADLVLDVSRSVAGIPAQPGSTKPAMPRALIKLSRNQTISEILGDRDGYGTVAANFAAGMASREWVGIILFGVPAKPGPATLLGKLVPEEILNQLQFTYLAATPSKTAVTGGTVPGYSISAFLEWRRRDSPAGDPPLDRTQEASFYLNSISGCWNQTTLQSLTVDTRLTFRRFLGLQNNGATEIQILGQFDRAANVLKFSAHVDQPIGLLSNENVNIAQGPIKQVWFKGAVLSLAGNIPHISVDGSIDLNAFTAPSLPTISLDGTVSSVDFNSLGIDLPETPQLNLKWLSIGYPSLLVNFDGPRFSIGPLVIKMFSLGIDFPQEGVAAFRWDDLVMLNEKPPTNVPCLLFGIRIELMKLPAILESSIQTLTFNLQVGAWSDASFTHWLSGQLAVGLSAVGFDRLNLDLFRFLEIAADKVLISEDTANRTTWLKLQNASMKVVGTTLFNNLDAAFFVRGKKSGFVLMWNEVLGNPATFAVDWAVIGNNIMLPANFIEQQMTLTPPDGDDDGDSTDDFTEAQNALKDWTDVNFVPVDDNSSSADWIIGAGITVLDGFFQGRFVYQEGRVCALSLKGDFLDWVGIDFGIAGAYFKGNRAEEDHFYISMTVPEVDVGDISFTGGVVAFDFYVNGGFLIDLGFPWQEANGAREWASALGAIVTPFQGSGGLYVERRNLTLPTDPTLEVTQLAAGYALQAGLGASFGGGMFTAWVTIGIYATIEGDLYLGGSKMVALRLSGAVGVLFRGHAGLNWWIISIDVDITIGAEASTTVEWVSDVKYLPLPGLDDASTKIVLILDFTVYASASASACIRLGFFSLCKSISVSIPMRAQYSLTL